MLITRVALAALTLLPPSLAVAQALTWHSRATNQTARVPVIGPAETNAFRGPIPARLRPGAKLRPADYSVDVDDAGGFVIRRNIGGWGLLSEGSAGGVRTRGFLLFARRGSASRLLALVEKPAQVSGQATVLDTRIVTAGAYETIYHGPLHCSLSPEVAYLAVVNAESGRMRAFRASGPRIEEADLPAPDAPCEAESGE
jgi:hypothetical protein